MTFLFKSTAIQPSAQVLDPSEQPQVRPSTSRKVLLKTSGQCLSSQSTQRSDQQSGRSKGKLSLLHQKSFVSHRCGWNYAIQALQPLHSDDGILFDGYLENSFVWRAYQPGQVKAPYRQPWVGFLHNPPNMPEWFAFDQSPQSLFARTDWQQSLEYCMGLFCLSHYQANWLREHTDKPVSALIHPTELPAVQFDYNRFAANPHKKIVQIGWWLRQLNAIFQLPVGADNALGYEKIMLIPTASAQFRAHIESIANKEKEAENLRFDAVAVANTRRLTHLPNDAYDRLLSENIVFVALHDSSANNAVIECIARATPLLVNPLPAVVEYLGVDYPLYFRTLEEAASKLLDMRLIEAAHEYLRDCELREKLSDDYFCRSFEASEVYKRI